MANIKNEVSSLVEVVHDWITDPTIQAHHNGNVGEYLVEKGYPAEVQASADFVQDFQDAAQIAVQPSVNFEASNQAIDIQGPTNNTTIESPSAVSGPAQLLSSPAAAYVPPPPPAIAATATPAEALQSVANYYTNHYVEYITENTTHVDNRTTQVDQSKNFDITTDHGDVDIRDFSDNNTVSGDGSFGANADDIEGVAVGDRAAAAGDDQEGVATGDRAVAGGRDAVGATGDGAIAAGDDIGAANSGTFEGLQVGDDIEDSEVQTITGNVDGIAANDSNVEDVINDSQLDRTVVSQGSGDVNANTGDLNRSAQNFGEGDQNAVTGDNKGIQAVDGDANGIQGSGNVGNALGEDATSTIDHSSVATNESRAGDVFDIEDSEGVNFGSGDVINDSQGVATHGSQAAFVDASANADDGSNADGGPVNVNFDGNQAVADDNSAASTDGDATAQNVFDSENVNQIGDDGDASVNDISHSENVAAVGNEGDATVDDSKFEDNSANDSFNNETEDSFNVDKTFEDSFNETDQDVDVHNADDVDTDF
jgi:hypothetical protein